MNTIKLNLSVKSSMLFEGRTITVRNKNCFPTPMSVKTQDLFGACDFYVYVYFNLSVLGSLMECTLIDSIKKFRNLSC